MTAERRKIVTEARKWVGTPYHCQGDVRGARVDCVMLIIRAYVDCGVCSSIDPRPYSDDWFLHRSEERYLGGVLEHCVEVQTPRPADVAVFRWGRCYSHGGIVTALVPLTIIHAFQPAGCVIEEPVESNCTLADPRRRPRFFSRWA